MNIKTIFQFLKSKFFWKNILLAIGIFLALFIFVLIMLRFITRHGEEVVVPDLRGMYLEEAEVALQNSGITFEVIDSVYLRSKGKGEITEQSPMPDTKVKKGRKIYVTVNFKSKKQVTVPEMRDVSYRQAKATLEALGFEVEITYKPSEFDNLVMDVKHNDISLAAGAHLEDGSKILLVVGQNNSDEEVTMPSLIGFSYSEALSLINGNNLVLGLADFDVAPADETEREEYIVYEQTPEEKVVCPAGKRVDIKLSRDKKKQRKSAAKHDEFF